MAIENLQARSNHPSQNQSKISGHGSMGQWMIKQEVIAVPQSNFENVMHNQTSNFKK